MMEQLVQLKPPKKKTHWKVGLYAVRQSVHSRSLTWISFSKLYFTL